MKNTLLLLAFLLSYALNAQGTYPIKNFSPSDYQGRNQNWSLAQSESGEIFVANNAGLMVYNGLRWTIYPAPNHSEVRSVYLSEDKIYVGAYREFGYWKKDEAGTLQYASVSQSIQADLLEDEQFWNISGIGDYIIFQSLKRLYFYNKDSGAVHFIAAPSNRARLFNVDDKLIFQVQDQGLQELVGGEPQTWINTAGINDRVIVHIAEVDQKVVLINEDGQFFIKEGKDLTRWYPEDKEVLEGVKVYSALQTRNGDWVIGTIDKGIIHLDEKGKLLQKVDRSLGLLNNTVLSLFEDNQGIIWLGLDSGLSLLFQESPFREYRDEVGQFGVIYAAVKMGDKLVLGTNQGLYVREDKGLNGFVLVPGSEGQVWFLRKEGTELLGGHHEGTFLYKEGVLKWLNKGPGTFNILPIPGHPDYLLQGSYQGLSVLKKTEQGWQFERSLEGFSISSRFFTFTDRNHLWVNHEYKGLFELELDEDLQEVKLIKQHQAYGQSSSLVEFQGKQLYAHTSGIHYWDKTTQKWEWDERFNQLFRSDHDVLNGILIPDNSNDHLWGIGEKGLIYLSQQKVDGSLIAQHIDLRQDIRQTLGNAGFECIAHIEDQTYLLGRNEGYLLIDLERIKNSEHELSIVKVEQDLFPSGEQNLNIENNSLELSANPGEVRIELGVNRIPVFQDTYYQYRLPGQSEEWSSWSTEPVIRLSGLPIGDYRCEFRSRINTSINSNEIYLLISVEPPWYASWWALVLYAIGFVMLLLGIHHIYRGYYKKEREKMQGRIQEQREREQQEAQQRITKIEYEKLQQEMESKNRELAISTMSMIKKNEFLNEIKRQLQQTELSEVKPIVRKINKSLSNEDDWKFFENAFNQADQHFLKKIKSTHPSLTSNDLKICAYLRLNLSSKEIAPLLNISVKSVEVKRYRLRKKLELDTKQSLIDYILQV